MTNLELTGTHRRTYDAVFQHPISRNLEWREVKSMLVALSDSAEEPNGNLKLTRNGQALLVYPPTRKDFSDVQELMKIRHFLQKSDGATQEATSESAGHLLVVIDHRQARIYKNEVHGAVPQRITPLDPDGSGRHLHYVQDDSNGQRRPERRSFYDAVAKSLQGAEQILLFGSGTGASSAMEQLLAELKQHHADLAKLVVGSIVTDEQHLTEDQLLAKARECYAKIGDGGLTGGGGGTTAKRRRREGARSMNPLPS